MMRKVEIKHEIQRCKRKIEWYEQKRSRSQAALTEAILTKTEPNDSDVDFFNSYTQLIDDEREKMHALMAELDSL